MSETHFLKCSFHIHFHTKFLRVLKENLPLRAISSFAFTNLVKYYFQRSEIQLDSIKSWFIKTLRMDLASGAKGSITELYIINELVQNSQHIVSNRPKSPKKSKISRIVLPVNVYGKGNDGNPKVVRKIDITMEEYCVLYFE